MRRNLFQSINIHGIQFQVKVCYVKKTQELNLLFCVNVNCYDQVCNSAVIYYIIYRLKLPNSQKNLSRHETLQQIGKFQKTNQQDIVQRSQVQEKKLPLFTNKDCFSQYIYIYQHCLGTR